MGRVGHIQTVLGFLLFGCLRCVKRTHDRHVAGSFENDFYCGDIFFKDRNWSLSQFLPNFGIVEVADAQVVGIDLGSEFIKAAIVAPGKRMEIILNSSSRRKTHNCVSFSNPTERSLGDEAIQQAVKSPSNVFTNTCMFLGQPSNLVAELSEDQQKAFDKELVISSGDEFMPLVDAGHLQPRNSLWPDGSSFRFSPYQLYLSPRKGVSIEVRKGQYMEPELLAANYLSFIRQMAASTASLQKTSALGTVLTVPCDIRQRQREALRIAAEVAGFKLLHLVHHGAAAALQQALDTPENPPMTRLYVTVGSANAEATVVRFTPVDKNQKLLVAKPTTDEANGKEESAKGENSSKTSKSDETTSLEVLGCATVWGVGGRWLTEQLAGSMAEEFMKTNPDTDISNSPRVLKKLLAQSSLTKVTLSASRQTNFRVENLINKKDFNTPVERNALEDLIVKSGTLDGMKKAITTALETAGVGFSDIGAFELLGGGWRVPRVYSELVEFVKQAKGVDAEDAQILGTHLNADEAAATGAAFVAANSTSTFRVKPIFLSDGSPYEYTLKLLGLGDGEQESGSDKEAGGARTKVLVKKMERPGSSRVLKLKAKQDFDVEILEDGDVLTTHKILGVAAAIKKREDDRAKELKTAAAETNSKETSEEKKEGSEGSDNAKGENLDATEDKFGSGEGAKSEQSMATENSDSKTAESEDSRDDQREESSGGGVENGDAAAASPEPRVVLTFAIDGAGVISLPMAEILFEEGTPVASSKVTDASGRKRKPKTVEIRMPLKVESRDVAIPFPLSRDQTKKLREVLKKLEKSDMDAAALREIKNTLEEFVYKVRASLVDEFVEQVTKESFREELRKKLEEEEDWIYGDADKAEYSSVEKRVEDLKKLVEPFQTRAREMSVRQSVIDKMTNGMNDFQSRLEQVIQKRPWISKERILGVQNSIKDLKKWWEEKHGEQEARSPILEPIYTEKEALSKLKVVSNSLKALNSIPKPTTTTTTVSQDTEKTFTTSEGERTNSTEKEQQENKTETSREEGPPAKDEL